MIQRVYWMAISAPKKNKTTDEKSECGGAMVQYKIKWSGEASLQKFHLSKHLKKVKL